MARYFALVVLIGQLAASVSAFAPTAAPLLRSTRHASACTGLRMQSGAHDVSRRNLMQGVAGAAIAGIAQGASAATAAPPKEKVVKLENGLAYVDKGKREGMLAGLEQAVGGGDFVIVDYIAYLRDGTIFDNTKKRGKPVTFQVGKNQVIPGLEIGLVGMKAGESRRLYVPSALGYKERGVCLEGKGCLVPPDTDLVYDVTLIRVAPAPI
eukprot:CAMPEP_0181301570 /NCGR_PEP_ID=MMETSP1101-20121128/7495_1 /TAXON_ID=46948 /ORGANISM="Rhodomonas abbreviata, Strain Caron Lab Isolate" /LENGTH=209 /DNA_ID=CAMNT_0023406885 /DNA_START=11 /DNA_END=640 /DNA_ORIENTATION=-